MVDRPCDILFVQCVSLY